MGLGTNESHAVEVEERCKYYGHVDILTVTAALYGSSNCYQETILKSSVRQKIIGVALRDWYLSARPDILFTSYRSYLLEYGAYRWALNFEYSLLVKRLLTWGESESWTPEMD